METRLSIRLKALRKSEALSSSQVIKMLKDNDLDYSEQSLYKWEEGNAIPPVNILDALAHIYHCNISYLLDDDDKVIKKVNANELAILRLYRTDFLYRSILNSIIKLLNRV